MAFLPPDPQLKYTVKQIQPTRPRAVVSVYGQRAIPVDFHVERGAHGVSDTASFTLPRNGGTDWSTLLRNPLANDGAVIAEVYAGYPRDPIPGSTDITQLSRRFMGIVNSYKVSGTTDLWTFECTSLASLLMAEKQTTLSQNQTTLQYLNAVAKQAHLKVNTQGLRDGFKPATLKQVFERDNVVGIHNIRPWNILQMCAKVDDVDLWLHVDTLYYWSPLTQSKLRKHVIFLYGQDLVEIEGEHAPQFSKNIEVELRVYNQKYRNSHMTRYLTDGSTTSKTRHSVTLPDFGTSGSTTVTSSDSGTTVSQTSSGGGAFNTGATTIPRESSKERYIEERKNLAPDQADAEAYRIWQQLSRAEYRVRMKFSMTPEYLPYATIETVHELYGCPWQQFNTGSQIPVDSKNKNQQQTLAAYFQRRTTETFDASGWEIEAEMLSHAPPNDAPL